MTTLAAFSASLITPAGRDIAARVALMIGRGLPIGDALAVAAELGMEQGRGLYPSAVTGVYLTPGEIAAWRLRFKKAKVELPR